MGETGMKLILPTENSNENYFGYWTDGKNVYSKDLLLDKIDLQTFILFEGTFAKDKNRCYWNGFTLRGADVETFEGLNWTFAKDKNHVWTLVGKLKEADAATFEVCDEGRRMSYLIVENQKKILAIPHGYGKDSRFVFYYDYNGKPNIVKKADTQTFISLNDGHFGKDKSFVFWGRTCLKNAKADTWEKLNTYYSKDHKRCFYMQGEIKGADAESFFTVGECYAYDKNNYYYQGTLTSKDDFEENKNAPWNLEKM